MAREQVKKKPAAKAAGAPDLSGGVLMRAGKIVTDDPWTLLGEGEPVPEAGDVIVPMARFQEEREALLARNAGRLGVLIGSAEKVEEIAPDLDRFDLVAVAFPAFRDGRGFTTARLVRERYGYKGELRAMGDVLPDLLFFMLRCGFTAFTLRSPHPERDYAEAARAFSAAYQGASDDLAPAHVLRARRRGGQP